MNDMHNITKGFTVLAKYDATNGSVDVGTDGFIYAGSQDLSPEDYTASDQTLLDDFGWSFDDRVGRWGYPG